MAELEKLGPKFRLALRVAKDPRFERLPCTHKGTYADDCLVQRVSQVASTKMTSVTPSLTHLLLSTSATLSPRVTRT